MTMISKCNTNRSACDYMQVFEKKLTEHSWLKNWRKREALVMKVRMISTVMILKKKDWKKPYHPLFDSCWGYSKNSQKTLAVVLCIKWSREC